MSLISTLSTPSLLTQFVLYEKLRHYITPVKLPEEKLNNMNFKAANKNFEILLLLLRFS